MRKIFLFVFGLTFLLAGCSTATSDTVVIEGVLDPITFLTSTGDRIRLIGIRTPDVTKSVECYGKEALLAAESLLGETVRLEKEPLLLVAQDGALPRYIFLEVEDTSPTGTGADVQEKSAMREILVNERALELGTAFPFASEDMLYGQRLLSAARYASATGRGLWSACEVKMEEAAQGNWLHTQKIEDCTIKATTTNDVKIYRTQHCSSYAETMVLQSRGDEWFCAENAAEATGFVKADDCN